MWNNWSAVEKIHKPLLKFINQGPWTSWSLQVVPPASPRQRHRPAVSAPSWQIKHQRQQFADTNWRCRSNLYIWTKQCNICIYIYMPNTSLYILRRETEQQVGQIMQCVTCTVFRIIVAVTMALIPTPLPMMTMFFGGTSCLNQLTNRWALDKYCHTQMRLSKTKHVVYNHMKNPEQLRDIQWSTRARWSHQLWIIAYRGILKHMKAPLPKLKNSLMSSGRASLGHYVNCTGLSTQPIVECQSQLRWLSDPVPRFVDIRNKTVVAGPFWASDITIGYYRWGSSWFPMISSS